MKLSGKIILITGAAKRVGKAMALSIAEAGGEVILHYNTSSAEAQQTQHEIQSLGAKCHLLQADLTDRTATQTLIERSIEISPLFALVNNASRYASLSLHETDLQTWDEHLEIHLTAPFLLSRAFAQHLNGSHGRIINMLDWQALRPNGTRFAYITSKAAMTSLTQSLAQALAPNITVNGLALGAILPPSEGELDEGKKLLEKIPAGRWATLKDVTDSLLFLLTGPDYITGEILHVDGGRHLT